MGDMIRTGVVEIYSLVHIITLGCGEQNKRSRSKRLP